MQGINRIDSWAQFTSLVQDARSRNRALATANGASAIAGPAKSIRSTGFKTVAGAMHAAAPLSTFKLSSGAAPVQGKISGSFFDAYA
jgi:hypothetical protein